MRLVGNLRYNVNEFSTYFFVFLLATFQRKTPLIKYKDTARPFVVALCFQHEDCSNFSKDTLGMHIVHKAGTI